MNKYILIIFPACFDKWEFVHQIIANKLNILEDKIVELNENEKFTLIYKLYEGEYWIGNNNNNWEGIYYKMHSCFPNNIKKIYMLYIQSDILEVKKVKQIVRKYCKCGNHSIHSVDSELLSLKIKKIFFNY